MRCTFRRYWKSFTPSRTLPTLPMGLRRAEILTGSCARKSACWSHLRESSYQAPLAERANQCAPAYDVKEQALGSNCPPVWHDDKRRPRFSLSEVCVSSASLGRPSNDGHTHREGHPRTFSPCALSNRASSSIRVADRRRFSRSCTWIALPSLENECLAPSSF
jgi:hypothetical protein